LFLQFLGGRARQADELFILGDLFEAWIGDDDCDAPFNAEVVAALRLASESGLKISAMHGNRDFLLGTGFTAASGVKLLTDPYILSTAEWQFVLSHGDALCLDDAAYMAFRTQVRNPAWQAALLAKPLAERRAIAAHMREVSESSQRGKENPYTDLQAAATDDFLREHGYATFIHGHTHQPAKHDHIVDGIHVERWVLADWHEDRGECLVWDGEALSREAITHENRP
jgi:UDP-2,3-diacylglucosamine hydrolase